MYRNSTDQQTIVSTARNEFRICNKVVSGRTSFSSQLSRAILVLPVAHALEDTGRTNSNSRTLDSSLGDQREQLWFLDPPLSVSFFKNSLLYQYVEYFADRNSTDVDQVRHILMCKTNADTHTSFFRFSVPPAQIHKHLGDPLKGICGGELHNSM